MKTQLELLKEAKKAYLIPVNDNWSRWSVYVLHENDLKVIWPKHNGEGKLEGLLPNQIKSTRKNYPCYHFYFNGGNYSKPYELKTILEEINPELQVERIQPGWSPSISVS